MNELIRHDQASAYDSPWKWFVRFKTQLWELVWSLLCRWTPKPLNAWRLFWLRRFGCKIYGKPFVHQRARITHPWRLTLYDRACLGDGAVAYSLGEIEIMQRATVAQEVYLCTGTHDLADPVLPLQTGKILIGPMSFIGARAFILPGVEVGERAIVGACAVVARDVEANALVAGNPAREIRKK